MVVILGLHSIRSYYRSLIIMQTSYDVLYVVYGYCESMYYA